MYSEFICDRHEMLYDRYDAMLMYYQIKPVKSFTGPENRAYINFSFMLQFQFSFMAGLYKVIQIKGTDFINTRICWKAGMSIMSWLQYIHHFLVLMHTVIDVLFPYQAQLAVVIRTELLTVPFNMKLKRNYELNNLLLKYYVDQFGLASYESWFSFRPVIETWQHRLTYQILSLLGLQTDQIFFSLPSKQ
jgi:hypothetical protein